MEIRHLRYAQVLAEELHFGKAAKRLFISQPPLSRQIKELEEELGVLLFERNNKRVVLTEAGKYFFKESRKLLKNLNHLKIRTLEIHQDITGELRIGYISSTNKAKMASFLNTLREAYPRLQVYLFETSTEKQVLALEQGKLDFGILRAPVYSPSVRWEVLFKDTFSIALPKSLIISGDYSTLGKFSFISYNRKYAPAYFNKLVECCSFLNFEPTVT